MQQFEEELAAYDDVLALFSKGVRLGELLRLPEELAAYQEVLRRFGDSGDPGLAQVAATARGEKRCLGEPAGEPWLCSRGHRWDNFRTGGAARQFFLEPQQSA